MASNGMKGSPMPKVRQEGTAKPYKNACDYQSQPGGAYGGKSGLQPFKARTHNYTPDTGRK